MKRLLLLCAVGLALRGALHLAAKAQTPSQPLPAEC